jgi:hypothetical protein
LQLPSGAPDVARRPFRAPDVQGLALLVVFVGKREGTTEVLRKEGVTLREVVTQLTSTPSAETKVEWLI